MVGDSTSLITINVEGILIIKITTKRRCSIVHIANTGVYLDPNCTDNPFFANCKLIVKARFCTNKYYARFCCKSCTLAGQLPPTGPHLLDYKTGTSNRR